MQYRSVRRALPAVGISLAVVVAAAVPTLAAVGSEVDRAASLSQAEKGAPTQDPAASTKDPSAEPSPSAIAAAAIGGAGASAASAVGEAGAEGAVTATGEASATSAEASSASSGESSPSSEAADASKAPSGTESAAPSSSAAASGGSSSKGKDDTPAAERPGSGGSRAGDSSTTESGDGGPTRATEAQTKASKQAATVLTPKRPDPLMTTVKPEAGGALITWEPTKGASHYTVTVSEDRPLTTNVRNYNVKGLSKRVSLDDNDGSQRYVRVIAHVGGKERIGARQLARPAAPKASGGEQISFATQNVMCGWCALPPNPAGKHPTEWNERWPLLASQVLSERPDVLMLQESTNKNGSMKGMASKLGAAGYRFDRKLEAGMIGTANRVWYNGNKFSKSASGRIQLVTGNGQRTAHWVKLRSKNTGKEFFAVSTHFGDGDAVTGATSKTTDAQLLSSRIDALNPGGLPVLLGGDLGVSPNASATSGPFRALVGDGYIDMQTAPKRKGDLYGTWNGFRAKAQTNDGRVDYLFTKNTGGPLEYRNLAKVASSGVVGVHGSDHNLVVAKTRLK